MNPVTLSENLPEGATKTDVNIPLLSGTRLKYYRTSNQVTQPHCSIDASLMLSFTTPSHSISCSPNVSQKILKVVKYNLDQIENSFAS